MSTTIKVRFRDGVLEPLENPGLKEGQEVNVTIETGDSGRDTSWLEESFGGWTGLIDSAEFKRHIDEARNLITRLEPRL